MWSNHALTSACPKPLPATSRRCHKLQLPPSNPNRIPSRHDNRILYPCRWRGAPDPARATPKPLQDWPRLPDALAAPEFAALDRQSRAACDRRAGAPVPPAKPISTPHPPRVLSLRGGLPLLFSIGRRARHLVVQHVYAGPPLRMQAGRGCPPMEARVMLRAGREWPFVP